MISVWQIQKMCQLSWKNMFITLIISADLLLWATKAQFSTKPNWAFKTMVVFSVYFLLTDSGYDYQPMGSIVIKSAIISVVIIGVFYLLARYRGIPTVLIILGILLAVYTFFTQKTVKGRHLYAIGGNMKAARLSGIKTKQMMFFAYTNMSFIAAIAGLVFAARLNSASPTAGQSFEMDAIASCFIGGASAYGGTGTVGGALIGALIMGILNNGMSILGINSNMQQVVKGLVLLGAVAFDVISKNNLISLPKLGKKRSA